MFNRFRFATLSVLAAAVMLAGCESADRLTGPSTLEHKIGNERVLITEHGKDGYKMVQETDPTVGTVTAVIDEKGGSLSIGGTTLDVPAGAVSGPTTFTVNKPNGELVFDFSATKSTPNDVGSAGFPVPLTLTIDYSKISSDMEAPAVVWIKPDGHAAELQTKVDAANRKMTAEITHFSLYGGADTLLGFVFGLLF
jgi:hypothetical protein